MSVLDRVREQERVVNSEDANQVELSRARERLKHDLVERLGLSAVAAMAANDQIEAARAEIGIACQAVLNTGDYGSLSAQDRDLVVRQVLDEVCGLGPLQPLLDDPTITEVMVNGCDKLFYERDGELYAAARVFESAEQIMLVVDRILAPLGRRLDQANPIVNARLANGDRADLPSPSASSRTASRRLTVSSSSERCQHGMRNSFRGRFMCGKTSPWQGELARERRRCSMRFRARSTSVSA